MTEQRQDEPGPSPFRAHLPDLTIPSWLDFARRLGSKKPLWKTYVRNMFVHSKAEMSVAELFSSKPGALYRIASRISESIDWWSSDRIWEHLSAMESFPRVSDVERSMDVTPQTDVTISDTSSLPLFSSYWGAHLQTPCSFRIPAIYMLDGQAAVMPRMPDGGLTILTYLNTEVLSRLKMDMEFIKYVQFRCS